MIRLALVLALAGCTFTVEEVKFAPIPCKQQAWPVRAANLKPYQLDSRDPGLCLQARRRELPRSER